MIAVRRAGAAALRPLAAAQARGLASKAISVDLPNVFKGHLIDTPAEKAQTNREELLDYLKTMYRMRRVEITCDTEYKARNIRGFCHLYDGQEAIATGMDAALTLQDSLITSYRCHAIAMTRGSTPAMVFSELFGFVQGTAKGKGGSMHFYSKKYNFYGGAGIVGAQVPVGVGLAFANKYNATPGEKMNIAIAMYGDGAANQGQIWEAANMASLWKLPAIFLIENNQYGMGTSIARSSSNNKYYTMGNHIPGIRIDGMNVLAVREGLKYAKEYCASGNGPLYIEMNTYRYHGHSMSDPGTSYRNRDEISGIRTARDPIEFVKKLLTDNNLATADEIKQIEKDIRDEVQQELAKAKAGNFPPAEELYTHIYADEKGQTEYPPFIRMPDYHRSLRRDNGNLVQISEL